MNLVSLPPFHSVCVRGGLHAYWTRSLYATQHHFFSFSIQLRTTNLLNQSVRFSTIWKIVNGMQAIADTNAMEWRPRHYIHNQKR